MTAPHQFPDPSPSRDGMARAMLDSVWAGRFDIVPTNYIDRLQWVDLAQWYQDVRDEPSDAAQVFAEVQTILDKSNALPVWLGLSDREGGPCFEMWFEGSAWFGINEREAA